MCKIPVPRDRALCPSCGREVPSSREVGRLDDLTKQQIAQENAEALRREEERAARRAAAEAARERERLERLAQDMRAARWAAHLEEAEAARRAEREREEREAWMQQKQKLSEDALRWEEMYRRAEGRVT